MSSSGRSPGAETIEVTEGLNVDIGADGEVVGFDIDQASRRMDLSTLETQASPFAVIRLADPVSEEVQAYLAEEKARLGR